jgi:hypothetical protein
VARGWESKSVEDQIADARADTRLPAVEISAAERDRLQRLGSLKLAAARARQDLQLACDRRHRATLEATLEHLAAEILKLTSHKETS